MSDNLWLALMVAGPFLVVLAILIVAFVSVIIEDKWRNER